MQLWLRWLRRLLLAGLAFGLLGLAAAGAVLWTVWPQLPDVAELRRIELQLPLTIESSDGKLIALYGETRRYPAPIASIPDRVRNAFLAAEDARFYEHEGLDFVGIFRAVWLIATTDRERVPGGSTITQQVARGFYLSNEYSYTRKLREMLLAVKMERVLEKDEILELYLNKIFFGNRAYGVAAAAEFYYGKPLDRLSVAEAAMLAGIPKFPSSANPVSNPARAMERRNHYVLPRMLELGYISQAEFEAALAEPNTAKPHEPPVEVDAPYVAEMVRQAMEARFGAEALTAGYRVVTTLRAADQNAAVASVRSGLLEYDRRRGWRGPEGRIEGAEASSTEALDRALEAYLPIPDLAAAVVLGLDADGARLHERGRGEQRLIAAGAAWTGRPLAQLLKAGDVVRLHRPSADAPPVLSQLPQAQAALVSLDAPTGALRALVGGFSYAQNTFYRATQAQRQPGSSFKPFVYAAAFERGYTPASIVMDAPVVFRDRAGNVWRPQNDKEDFAGPMRLREAMVQSRNLVSVRLLDAIGVQFAQRYITQFGFPPESLPPNLSMSLGTASLTPMSIAEGYALFANGGYHVRPWFIARVVDRNGTVVMDAHPPRACPECGGPAGAPAGQPTVVDGFNFGAAAAPPETAAAAVAAEPAPPPGQGLDVAGPPEQPPVTRTIDPRTAYLVRSLMLDVVRRGTGTAARVLGRDDIGGKTGSTNDHRDAWFSGFGGDLVTTVWVGRDDFTPLGRGEYGGRAALPIWIGYMGKALEDRPVLAPAPPTGLVAVTIDPGSGALLPEGSPGGLAEYVKAEDYDRMLAGGLGTEATTVEEQAFDVF
ncbi:MAG: penicillin-binding protein 1A [Lysobacteraceae bacterium]